MSCRDSGDVSEDKLQDMKASVVGTTDIQEALQRVSLGSDASTIHHRFIIGGATIYKAALEYAGSQQTSPGTSTKIDRILLTRILSPAFDECDVFFPEFQETLGPDGEPLWKQSSHEELEAWVGGDVPKGTQRERGVEYEFQMWTCKI